MSVPPVGCRAHVCSRAPVDACARFSRGDTSAWDRSARRQLHVERLENLSARFTKAAAASYSARRPLRSRLPRARPVTVCPSRFRRLSGREALPHRGFDLRLPHGESSRASFHERMGRSFYCGDVHSIPWLF